MRTQPLSRRLFLALASTGAVALSGTGQARAATAIVRLALDRRIDGATAPFAVAAARGFYRTENLDVTLLPATSAPTALTRLAKGDADIALSDFNELVRYRDKADVPALKVIFAFYNENGYAIVARRSRGVDNIADLQGKTIGVAEGDLAVRLWPALSKRIGLDNSKMKLEKIGAAVREPMLSAGQVDGVFGLSYASAINLRDRGVPQSDLMVFRFSDFGDMSYGQCLIVNPAFASANPEAVSAFLRAIVAGIKFCVKDPAKAVDDVMSQMDGGSRDLELERLRTVLSDNIVTADVRRDGLGPITPERFKEASGLIAADFKFRNPPAIADIYTDAFLPSPGSRKIG